MLAYALIIPKKEPQGGFSGDSNKITSKKWTLYKMGHFKEPNNRFVVSLIAQMEP